jgi:hypothetical protein
MTRAVITAAAICLLITAQVRAQVGVGVGVGGGYGVPFYGGGYHASTAAEGYATGMGNLVSAAGSYNLQTSQAAINLETARSQNLDNRLKGTQTYFEMQKINTAARKSTESPYMSSEDSWRYASMSAPKRLSATQLDPVTGKIYWPLVLRDPRYSDYCKQLDQLFVMRENSHGGIGYETYQQVEGLIKSFMADLQKNINDYDADAYLKARSFIESLGYEAKLPAV